MPSSAVRAFADPEDYGAAIRATKAEMTVTGRGHFAAKLTRIDLHRLWMQRFSDNLPRIGHSASPTGRAIISFRTQPGPSLIWGGVELQPSNIIRHNEGGDAFQHSSGSACWGAMSLPVEAMASAGAAIAGYDLTPPRDMLIVSPPPSAMAKLQRLHAAAGQMAEDAPAVIAHPEAARGLEQALIEAMVGCLGDGEVREDRSALRHHAMILRRFRRAVEENPDQALYIPLAHVLQLLDDISDIVVHLLHAGLVEAQSLPPCVPTIASYFGDSTVVTCIRAGLYQTKNGLLVFDKSWKPPDIERIN